MTHECVTSLDGAAVIQRAKQFFAERVPHNAAFAESEGPTYLTLRGQGGEEIALVTIPNGTTTRVRASTLFFDQAVSRFLTTLPLPAEMAA